MLHRALKTARGFERQKLGRRQKTARQKKEEGELGRLDAEVKALKVLCAMLSNLVYQTLTISIFLGFGSGCHG